MNDRPTPETDAMCICTHHKSFAATGGVVNPDFARRLERERDEARKEIESIKKLLLDPNAVRINMLHGKIAKLDWEKLEHIHGPHPARDQLAAERALADRLAEAFKDLWDNHTMYGAGYEVVEKALAAWKEARSE